MKCQLVGFSHGEFTNKDTGEVTKSCTLSFVRKPKLSENVTGSVACRCTVYGENVDKLPSLKENAVYDCDINTFKGKDYLNEMNSI